MRPLSLLKFFSRQRSLKRLPTLESDANRANRPQVIREWVSPERILHLVESARARAEDGAQRQKTDDRRRSSDDRHPQLRSAVVHHPSSAFQMPSLVLSSSFTDCGLAL